MEQMIGTNIEGAGPSGASGAPFEGAASEGRPTLMGTQHSSRLFCARCGAHNAPGWASCFNCGAARPPLSNGPRYAAALAAAMISAATFLLMWKAAHVPVTYVLAPPPAPVAVTNVVVTTIPTQVVAQQVLVVRQSSDGESVSMTYSCTPQTQVTLVQRESYTVVPPLPVEQPAETVVSSPVDTETYSMHTRPMLPQAVIVATTGGSSRQ